MYNLYITRYYNTKSNNYLFVICLYELTFNRFTVRYNKYDIRGYAE